VVCAKVHAVCEVPLLPNNIEVWL